MHVLEVIWCGTLHTTELRLFSTSCKNLLARSLRLFSSTRIAEKLILMGCTTCCELVLQSLKALFHLLSESTRKLSASIFIQLQCSKVYFDVTQALATRLQAAFAITEKEPLKHDQIVKG